MRRLTQARVVTFALFLTLLSFIASISSIAGAAPLKVRVRGAAKISARGWREQVGAGTELVLSGSLADDAALAIPNQPVVVRVARETNPHDPKVAEGLRAARSCDRGGVHNVKVSGPRDAPEITVSTDETGRFCFRAPLDPDRYKATVVYAPPGGRGLVDGAEREIGFDLSRRGLSLRFDPSPKIFELDTPRVNIEAVALHDDEDSPHVAPGLVVVLANEKGELGRSTTDGSGRARFALPGSKLGPPGVGELRASFAGNSDIAATTTTEEIERHVKVTIRVPAAEKGELEPKIPEEGIPIVAEITSSVGPIAEGSVEARIGDVVVGAAPVERGIARLTLTFATTSNEALVRLRYVQSAPWYEPIGEPTIKVPIRGPSLLAKAPLLLAGLAVIAFFLVGRVSGPKIKPAPAPAKPDQLPDPKPRIEVVRAAERGQEGWTGRVVDAHEGTPIEGARVWIERGTFDGRARLVGFETKSDGRFALGGIGPIAGDEVILAEGRLHARFSQALPAPGELTIAIAQRRRALLAQLVAFAKKRGAPFDVRPEPTPGHVRRAAQGDPRDAGTVKWAAAMEDAVFGPGEVDARVEEKVTRLDPEKPDQPR